MCTTDPESKGELESILIKRQPGDGSTLITDWLRVKNLQVIETCYFSCVD